MATTLPNLPGEFYPTHIVDTVKCGHGFEIGQTIRQITGVSTDNDALFVDSFGDMWYLQMSEVRVVK